jgi:hypothetical protein
MFTTPRFIASRRAASKQRPGKNPAQGVPILFQQQNVSNDDD